MPERLEDALAQSDVVICATGAPQLLHREQLRLAVARRDLRSTPLLLIDLSVPRAVDPTAAELPGVDLHTIDELRGSIESTLVQRRAAVPEAYAIVAAETERFEEWRRRREAGMSGSGTASLRRDHQTGRAPRPLPGDHVATH
jgi:glutamyl-tRNA reductase